MPIPVDSSSPSLPFFKVPELSDNQDGWGPTTVPEHFKDVPYAPYNKSDKVGKVADWTGQSYKYGQGRYDRERGVNVAFNFFHNEEESTFHLVDSKPAAKPKFGLRRFQPNRFQNRNRDDANRNRNEPQGGRDVGGGADRERQRRERVQQQKRQQYNVYYQDNRHNARITYNSSVDIRPEWSVIEQIQLSSLTKLNSDVKDPQDIVTCGALEFYDKSYDRVTPKSEKAVERFESRQFPHVTTSDDPIIRRLASEDQGTVFATDTLLSTLMCSARSVYSWDIVIQKVGKKIFFDQRDATFDLLTVNETANQAEVLSEEGINCVASLRQEATALNQNFSQQVLQKGGAEHKFEEANPFVTEGEDVATVAYRYRKWKLDNDIVLIARCKLDCAVELKDQISLCTTNALNEYDSKLTGVDWRLKMENQKGAVLATELKNNANKLAKWTAQALLSGADIMKLAYISRVHPKDNIHHSVLSVQGYKPKEFANQIALNTSNMWGIFKYIVDICVKLEDGKYILVKDPSKPILRLYEVPSDAFENDYSEEPLAEETPKGEGPSSGEKDESFDAEKLQ